MRSRRKRWSVVAAEREETDFLTNNTDLHSFIPETFSSHKTYLHLRDLYRSPPSCICVGCARALMWLLCWSLGCLIPETFHNCEIKSRRQKTRNSVFLSPFPAAFPCALWERTAQQRRRRRIRNALETAQHAQPASMCIGGN